ncbi:MAG: glucose-1-phosphate adenylyltransferase subunit GlgD [Oscillospiraceae bacterium]|nr:glucose-1-phosphate adenylyltransferase subunit GlgD [Oscillospiraceae bacterium]
MSNKYHGIIFAYSEAPELGDLTRERTVASLPFCGRYRLIDFALSSLRNANVTDVGVIMARDYQSLLDHIGSGKDWDMSRRSGGLRMLPPFGLPHSHTGIYSGTIEALNAVAAYIRDIPQENVILMLGSLLANIDLSAAIAKHEAGDAEITAICAEGPTVGLNHHYFTDENGYVKEIHLYRGDSGSGLKSLEGYIIRKDVLLRMMDECASRNQYAFHRDGIAHFLELGHKMDVYIHTGYVCAIRNTAQYYIASMDMLDAEKRHQIFPADRPVRTKIHEEVSSYFGEHAVAKNSLVADNCIIEGELENCIVFSGCRVGADTKLKNCIIMRGVTIGEHAELSYIISDKYAKFSDRTRLFGSPKLPTVVPKKSEI